MDQNKTDHRKKLKKSLLKKLTITWLGVIIIASIASGMLIQFGLQKASVVQQLIEKKAQQEEIKDNPLTLSTYRSEKYGYEISFNPDVFKTDRATNLEQNDLSEIGLSTKQTAQSHALGYILLNAYDQSELQSIEADKTVQGSSLLEKATNWYQTKKFKDLTDTSSFVKKEKIERWGAEAYQLTYKRRVLNTDVFHYIYVTIKNDKLYTVLADYPKDGSSEQLVESWIDEIAFINPQTATVKAANTREKVELNEVKLVELSKPSVVQIVSVNCFSIKLKDPTKVTYLQPAYELCTGGSGSGFLVGKEGLIATNGHVAKASFADLLFSGKQEPTSNDFYSDFVTELLSKNGQSATSAASPSAQVNREALLNSPSLIDAVIKKINDYVDENILEKPQFNDKYFVKLGNEPIKFPKPSVQAKSLFSYKNLQPVDRDKTIVDAELVGYDFSGLISLSNASNAGKTSSAKREKSSDVALIKVKDSAIKEFPGLPLTESATVKEGQTLLVIGYPGLVSGQDQKSSFLLDETASSVRPTITRGIVSAIKQDTFGQKLIQTDASIEHGNSGGPAFNYSGEVIGIATYVMASGSGNYNFLRAADDLFALMDTLSIDKSQQSESYNAWKRGLQFFWEGKLTKAKEQFERVESLYPIHPLVSEYIESANQGIQNGEDSELLDPQELKSFGFTQSELAIYLAIAMAVLIVIGGIITTYFIYDHKQKMNVVLAIQQPSLPNQNSPKN